MSVYAKTCILFGFIQITGTNDTKSIITIESLSKNIIKVKEHSILFLKYCADKRQFN